MALEQKIGDLASEAMVKSIPTQPVESTESEAPCAANDTACTQRWIAAFSDCC